MFTGNVGQVSPSLQSVSECGGSGGRGAFPFLCKLNCNSQQCRTGDAQQEMYRDLHCNFSANCSQLQLNYIAETSNVFSTEIESQRRLVLCRITETFISVHLKPNAFNCKSPQIIKAEHFQMYHTKTTQNQQNIKHQTQNFKNAKPHYKELQTYHNHAACKVKLQFPPLQLYKYTQIYKHRNIQLQNTQIHNIPHCTACTSLRMHLGRTSAELQLAPLQILAML